MVKPTGLGKEAIDTLKPQVINAVNRDVVGEQTYDIAMAEGLKDLCFIPVVNRGRVLGVLGVGRTTENSFRPEDVDFLTQAAGQIAIAMENTLAYLIFHSCNEAQQRYCEGWADRPSCKSLISLRMAFTVASTKIWPFSFVASVGSPHAPVGE